MIVGGSAVMSMLDGERSILYPNGGLTRTYFVLRRADGVRQLYLFRVPPHVEQRILPGIDHSEQPLSLGLPVSPGQGSGVACRGGVGVAVGVVVASCPCVVES